MGAPVLIRQVYVTGNTTNDYSAVMSLETGDLILATTGLLHMYHESRPCSGEQTRCWTPNL